MVGQSIVPGPGGRQAWQSKTVILLAPRSHEKEDGARHKHPSRVSPQWLVSSNQDLLPTAPPPPNSPFSYEPIPVLNH